MALTVEESLAIIAQVERVTCEQATYVAMAFNDPKMLFSRLELRLDEDLTPEERWKKGIARLQ